MDAKTERVVLVHDWLTGMRGGEKCLEVACRRWPGAPLFTLLYRPGTLTGAIESRPIHTSWMQRLPRVDRYYRYLLPLMPRAARDWSIPDCDLVLSFSHCVAKSAIAPSRAVHVCYCFTPMRYAWHMRQTYFGNRLSPGALARDRMLARLREWDRQTASGVTHFVAISQTVQGRIRECYGRESEVIYPPVDTEFYTPAAVPRENYYLVVSAFAPYKRLDLAIEACQRLKRPLVLIGQGQDEQRLRARASGNVHFLGWQPDRVVRDHLRRCQALLFPGEEDFGIVPVEAQACGAPVIAYGRGGATETVIGPNDGPEPTGLFFPEQTARALSDAIVDFERVGRAFSSQAARRQALRFNSRRFEAEFFAHMEYCLRREQPERRAA
jgi:glycosyltransferase involved in cell wall biosynthesis